MIYFVVTVEIFSGKFKIECVENKNKYLMNGYVSSFFEKPNKNFLKGKTTNTFNHLKSLQEVHSESVSEKSEDEKEFSIEYKGEGTVSPPIPTSPQRSSTLSSEIPNVQPSPPVLSKNDSNKVLINGKIEKKKFSIDIQKETFNTNLTSNEEFDDFFENSDDIVFCYDDKEKKNEKNSGESDEPQIKKKNPEERIKIYTMESIDFKVKKRKNKDDALNQSSKSLTTGLNQMKYEKFYRKKIPLSIHGKKDYEVEKISKVSDIIFVNRNGTIACGFTLKSVLALAEYSLFN